MRYCEFAVKNAGAIINLFNDSPHFIFPLQIKLGTFFTDA